MLGGSSSLNAMIYIRGNRLDYDEWAALGLDGWGYEDVLPYFKRAEDNERGASRCHGVGGPLSVSDGRSMHPLVEAIIEAAIRSASRRNEDHNGAVQDGAGRFQVTQRDGRRCSTAVAYLRPGRRARQRRRPHGRARARGSCSRATRAVGVEVLRGDRLEQIRAEREVIVCAGAYHSPQLLHALRRRPGGDLAPMRHRGPPRPAGGREPPGPPDARFVVLTATGSLMSFAAHPRRRAQYEADGQGPITSNVGEGGAFVRTRDGLDAPDVQFHIGGMLLHEEFLGVPFDDAYTFGPAVVKPSSRGRVTLRSPVPHARPRILHNYLQTEEDRAR